MHASPFAPAPTGRVPDRSATRAHAWRTSVRSASATSRPTVAPAVTVGTRPTAGPATPVGSRPAAPAARRPPVRLSVLGLVAAFLVAFAPPAARADDPAPATGVLRGQVTLRDGSSAGPGTVSLVKMDSDDHDYVTAAVDADGRWSTPVRSGRWTVRASTTAGLPTSWPDVPGAWPEELRPRVTVTAGETRDGVDIRERPRLAQGAVDEYGAWNPGSDDPTEPESTGVPVIGGPDHEIAAFE
ncbi:hypothetical protein AB0L40_27800 [Patulibacter sp. NPDC049589]|uniref:hypothetical protein n=1 Tax=Patulibacter sp. NPDC049589 TaxID=3154731 RepID=UPI00344231C8